MTRSIDKVGVPSRQKKRPLYGGVEPEMLSPAGLTVGSIYFRDTVSTKFRQNLHNGSFGGADRIDSSFVMNGLWNPA